MLVNMANNKSVHVSTQSCVYIVCVYFMCVFVSVCLYVGDVVS